MRQSNSITNAPHSPDEESGQFPSCTSTRHPVEETGSDLRLNLNHGKVKNYYQDVEFFTANTSSGATNGKNRRSYFFCLSRHSFLRLFVGLSLFMMAFLFVSVCLVQLQDITPNTSSSNISSSHASFVSEEAQGHTPSHLIIVPGHAIYLGHLLNDTAAIAGSGHRDILKLDEEDEIYLRDGWLLQNSFQLDQTPYYIRHIHRGIELMTQDPQSILMFSGGQTRRLAGPISEAASYTIFSIQRGFLSREQFNERVILEEFARDSYENVLFSVARYFQRFGMYPKKVTFVGFPFKKQRIMMHFSVISTIVPKFTYDGATMTAEAISEISQRLSYPLHIPTTTDLYSPKIDASTRASFQVSKNGCSPELLNKRIKRNPFHLVHSYYYSSTAELAPFFGDCFNKHF